MTAPDENNLDGETSPYLQDHADNPVHWYPWGEEALEQSRKEDKPIFLSIGYSACHWCHVMKRESFSDPETADRMNDWFVNIKVDREERPDLDEIYMQAVQSMTGRGGWPMSVFLTPDLKPFYGGTYFPPEPKQGMPDFMTVLERVKETYDSKRQNVEESADKLTDRLKSMEKLEGADQAPSPDLLGQAHEQLESQFDEEWGGFGDQPKFPRVMDLQLLFRLRDEEAYSDSSETMILTTLDHMMRGGIFDQIGGGFSRYSTDRQWLVPHFEKMLYDNAQLLDIYGLADAQFDRKQFKEVLELTNSYIDREMTHPDGGFYSSQDAESEGEEGKFYVWDYDEFEDVLGEEARVMSDFWGVTPDGNFEGKNILHRSNPLPEFCRQKELPENVFRDRLEDARKDLLEVREDRIKPHRDEKLLASWNGLMAASMARTGFYQDNDELIQSAVRAVNFVLDSHRKNGELHHTYREGKTHVPAFLDDYAFLIKAMLEIFQVTGNWSWLGKADKFYNRTLDRFWDDDNHGFFHTETRHTDLLVRSKNPRDKAQPSGNSEMIHNALKLSIITGKQEYQDHAKKTLGTFQRHLEKAPTGMTRMLCGLYDYHNQSEEILVVGSDNAREAFLDVIREYPQPGRVLLQADPETMGESESPLLQGRLSDPLPSAYFCRGGACKEPATGPDMLRNQLGASEL